MLWNTVDVTLVVIMILKDAESFQVGLLFIVSVFCAWNITLWRSTVASTYLKVKSAKCLICFLPVVFFLVLLFRSWSCLGLKYVVLFTSLVFIIPSQHVSILYIVHSAKLELIDGWQIRNKARESFLMWQMPIKYNLWPAVGPPHYAPPLTSPRPLTFWPWKWCPIHVWRGLLNCVQQLGVICKFE